MKPQRHYGRCLLIIRRCWKEHKQLHEALYRTADLHLYSGDIYHTNEQLLEDARDTQLSAELAEKLWRFGRYLFISGTAQGALPFPLYGIWPCGYEREFTHHVANENVQSIYWHAEVGGLAALTAPLINYYCDRMEAFRENARQLFGCRGIFVGTYTTPKNAAVAWYVPVILHFIGVAGWLSSRFYRYYQFTGDEKLFTEKILRFMVEAAMFYEDYYYLDTDGTLALYPAVSPENSPLEFHDKTKPHSMPFRCFGTMIDCSRNAVMNIASLKKWVDILAVRYSRKAYLDGDKAALTALLADYTEVEKRVDTFYEVYRVQWMRENKPHGFDVQDIRLGGLARRVCDCRERLSLYLNGEIEHIEELEEPVLHHSGNPAAQAGPTCFNGWGSNASANVVS